MDSSEQQVLAVVRVNESSVLYASDQSGVQFTHSLDNITYVNPEASWANGWLRYYMLATLLRVHQTDCLSCQITSLFLFCNIDIFVFAIVLKFYWFSSPLITRTTRLVV